MSIDPGPPSPHCSSPPRLTIDLAPCCRVCWDIGRVCNATGRADAATGRLLFFVSIPMGLYRTQIVPGGCEQPRTQGQPQAAGAGRFVLGDWRPAVDEAPPGAAALPDARIAALARQARPD